MKTQSKHWHRGILTMLVGAILVPAAFSATPLPGFRYYGRVVSEDGRPFVYDEAVHLVMTLAGRELQRSRLYLSISGMNYELEAPLSGGPGRYRAHAIRQGETPSFHLEINGVQYPVIPLGVPPPPTRPGGEVRLDMRTGTDSTGHGLPDSYLEQILLAFPELYSAIADISPHDDPTGKGQTILEDYIAGTSPLWRFDVFHMADTSMLPDGRIEMRFPTAFGRIYHVQATSDLAAGESAWQPAPVALRQGDQPTRNQVVGNGQIRSVYLDLPEALTLFRVTVE